MFTPFPLLRFGRISYSWPIGSVGEKFALDPAELVSFRIEQIRSRTLGGS
jgi:hypothetical protein